MQSPRGFHIALVIATRSTSSSIELGNLVTDTERLSVLENGKVTFPKPRYHYAIFLERPASPADGSHFPQNIRIENNLFDPGIAGISNVPLPFADGLQPRANQ